MPRNCSRVSWDNLASMLNPYLVKLPNDPINANISDPRNDGNHTYAYCSTSDGSAYDLITLLEREDDLIRCGKNQKIAYVYTEEQNDGTQYKWCRPDNLTCGWTFIFGQSFWGCSEPAIAYLDVISPEGSWQIYSNR